MLKKKTRTKKARSRESKNEEYFKGIIRDLEKQVRSLQKELSRLRKQEHIFLDTPKLDYEEYEEESSLVKCPLCKKGNVVVFNVRHLTFKSCDQCDWKLKESSKNETR